jgi:hypothetical protein
MFLAKTGSTRPQETKREPAAATDSLFERHALALAAEEKLELANR